jgi:cytochrome c-type biogenesis protein
MTFQVALLSIGLGLLGFVEPCSMGSNLLLIKHLGERSYRSALLQLSVYTGIRALFMGLLGAAAALIGGYFFELQRALWIGLGLVYLGLGLLYLSRRQGWLIARLQSLLSSARGIRGSAALGLVFGLNVPACAVPLIVVLLGLSASHAASGNAPAQGFFSLLLFGLALSLPLVLAVLWAPARRGLDWLAGLSGRMPRWTGAVLALLGLWSIGSGLFAHLPVVAQ